MNQGKVTFIKLKFIPLKVKSAELKQLGELIRSLEMKSDYTVDELADAFDEYQLYIRK